jgi:hypothetical protein
MEPVEIYNARESFKAYTEHLNSDDPKDTDQMQRLFILDAIAPICEHDQLFNAKTKTGRTASKLWQILISESSAWEIAHGY